MIDLGSKKRKLYFIKLKDGKVLKIKMPTRSMLVDLINFRNMDADTDLEIMEELYDFMLKIFNRNENDRVFTTEEIEDMFDDINLAIYVLKDYLNFALNKLGE